MNIIVSGLTAAGKTTHSRLLIQELAGLGFEYISPSKLRLKKLGGRSENNKPLDYWITDEAIALSQARKKDPESDKQLDSELMEIINANDRNWVADVRSGPWLSKAPAIRVWLESSLESRVIKALISYKGTSHFSQEEVSRRIALVDKYDCDYFAENYGFELASDKTPFDIVLDISTFTTVATYEASLASISGVQAILGTLVRWRLCGHKDLSPLRKLYYNDPKHILLKIPQELRSAMS